MENLYSQIAFVLLGGLILGSALLVVTLKNLVHSVLWLIVTFIGVAGIFLMLNADFVAAVQVLVYAGAVCIMLVFGVMLVQRPDMKNSNPVNYRFKLAAPVVGGLFILIGLFAAKAQWVYSGKEVPQNTVQALAPILLADFVIPFEVAAILLTVALTGALVLVKGVKVNGNRS
ncbi:NADH-quinone oxidoreductase subunit J [Desulforamulus ruminis]|uniref:NADH-quinone oxidoreductase subunit J n=1 Tax=Desulforamulus ruminis (strain ATCC 23193 / DSM 2154 / NCIMB 8452 / DL) TaxID=696281 RepID=F6DTL5_DESRL|nr:NADH-quinone oxidoreductase subunit J [Desulforamulus ruminis]AEG60077.1 NADH-ubiquinone/plastoquinone oxidoreductase chain 6 [Desulforamulus ruminis DSM 2154]